MRVYKLQATVAAGSNDSIAQLDIVEDGQNKSGPVGGLAFRNGLAERSLPC